MAFYCYIVECANGAYYTGWTTDPARRVKQHNAGKGAAYTFMHRPVKLVYVEEQPNRTTAMKREIQIKTWSHTKKHKFVHNTMLRENSFRENPELMKTNKIKKFLTLAPGRVNLLGEHVDYNDGIVLPVAIDRYVRLDWEPIDLPQIQYYAADMDQSVTIPLDDLEKKIDIDGNPLPSFALYPAGVAWALQSAGYPVSGLDVTLTSNVPIGAGLSSSAAVEVGFAVSWQHIATWKISDMALTLLCQKAENQYVGVNSGIMDQFASKFGVKDHAIMFDTRSLDWKAVPLPSGTSIVVADSSVRRTLVGSAYNDRRADCQTALALLKEHLPGIIALRDVTPTQFDQYEHLLERNPRLRARHVVDECERVRQAVDLLQENNAVDFGKLMFDCHASLRDNFEVSVPELDTLVEIAAIEPGCLGARITGGGFGGCTVNLVKTEKVDEFITNLSEKYHAATGKDARVYVCQAGAGAAVVG